jgi:FixJ family two-component response regulator
MQLGQIMNPRDERNWMIPRPNTKRRQVYDLLVAGKRAGEIMKELNLTRKAYSSHRHFITSWENANKNSYAVKNANRLIVTLRRVGNEFHA